MSNHKSSFTFLPFLLLLLVAGCSEEDRQTLGALSDMAESLDAFEEAAPSTYTDNCIEPLGGLLDASKNSDQPSMSSTQQSEAVTLLNLCVEEMQLEIDLTRKEYPEINELTECNKNLNSVIASKSELQARVQKFQSLPNNTSQDSSAVAMDFLGISLAMMSEGGSIALNRLSICVLEKVAPERLKQES